MDIICQILGDLQRATNRSDSAQRPVGHGHSEGLHGRDSWHERATVFRHRETTDSGSGKETKNQDEKKADSGLNWMEEE